MIMYDENGETYTPNERKAEQRLTFEKKQKLSTDPSTSTFVSIINDDNFCLCGTVAGINGNGFHKKNYLFSLAPLVNICHDDDFDSDLTFHISSVP